MMREWRSASVGCGPREGCSGGRWGRGGRVLKAKGEAMRRDGAAGSRAHPQVVRGSPGWTEWASWLGGRWGQRAMKGPDGTPTILEPLSFSTMLPR